MQNKTLTYHSFLTISRVVCCILISFVMVPSCKKSFSSDQLEDDKLVILAEITAGDSIKLPVGKTIKISNGSLIRFEKVNDASAVITEGNAGSYILQPNFSPQFATNPTTVFTNRRRLKPNTTYSIEIKHPTLGIARATTYIPALPHVTNIDTSFGDYQGRSVLIADITWQDGPDNDYYIIEVLKETVKVGHYFYYHGVRYNYDTPNGKKLYDQVKSTGVPLLKDTIPQNKFTRINLYTQDDNSANSGIDNFSNPFRRIFFNDHAFSGQSYTTRVYIDQQYFIATDPTQIGRIRLQFKAASKELYDYLLTYEKYKTDFGSVPTTQLVSPAGNIENGLGIFGGSARRERILYFDQLN